MLTITKLKMWKDPGYTRNCADVPPMGSKKLPAADYTLAQGETLRPRKNSTLTALELPLSYISVFEMSYLYIEASDGNGTLALFGWITAVEQIASSEAAVRITWDVDWWRSFSGDAELKTGMIVKCPNGTYRRPYRTQPRYWRITHNYPIHDGRVPSGKIDLSLWVYVFTVWNKVSSGTTTEIVTQSRILCAPVNAKYKNNSNETEVAGFPLDKLYAGELDEWVNSNSGSVAPGSTAKIIGAWLAPIAPSDFSFDSTNDIWIGDGTGYESLGSGTANDPHMVLFYASTTLDTTFTCNILSGVADDSNKVSVTDFQGNILGHSIYGLESGALKGLLDIGPNGGYMYVRFAYRGEPDSIVYDSDADNPYGPINTTSEAARKHLAPVIGCGYSIPLPEVPVNENQWSDYMYAGQRDFDITNARIANDKQAVSGLESAASSAIGGGVTGASAGPAGAVAGMIGGGLLSGVMTGVNYLLGENFNKQLQDATDKLYANQKNGIALSGGSKTKLLLSNTYYPMLIREEPDPVSKAELIADLSINGYDTDIPVPDVSTFISGTTGPYRIINLTVTGSIPPQAKQYIKDKFDAGIRIVENNPSGVVP